MEWNSPRYVRFENVYLGKAVFAAGNYRRQLSVAVGGRHMFRLGWTRIIWIGHTEQFFSDYFCIDLGFFFDYDHGI